MAVLVVALLGVAIKHARIVVILSELLLEGAVFRGIPVWLALGLVLGMPLALQLRRRQVPVTVTVLVIGLGAAMLVLARGRSRGPDR